MVKVGTNASDDFVNRSRVVLEFIFEDIMVLSSHLDPK
jgi:hypothetical protein